MSTDTSDLMRKGYAALKAKRYPKAVRLGQRLVDLHHSSGFEILGLAYAAVGRRSEAIATLEKGVAAAPSVWLLWELLANNYSEEGRYADAQRCYGKALTCPKVDSSYVHFNAAIAFARDHQYTSALKAVNQVASPQFADGVAALRAAVTASQERLAMPDVWFFLIEVRALPGGDMYAPGSLGLVQCCVPEHRLEDALPALDAFLTDRHYERTDLLIAHRYGPRNPDEEPPETASHEFIQAAKSRQPVLGLFVHAKDSAKLLGQMEPNSPPVRRKRWWPF